MCNLYCDGDKATTTSKWFLISWAPEGCITDMLSKFQVQIQMQQEPNATASARPGPVRKTDLLPAAGLLPIPPKSNPTECYQNSFANAHQWQRTPCCFRILTSACASAGAGAFFSQQTTLPGLESLICPQWQSKHFLNGIRPKPILVSSLA